MLADYHVHTEFSNDSIYPMEEVVKDAISLGIKDICFTDHVDYGPYRDWMTQEELNIVRETRESQSRLLLPMSIMENIFL